MKYVKKFFSILMLSFLVLFPSVSTVYADSVSDTICDEKRNAPEEIRQAYGCPGTTSPKNDLRDRAIIIINSVMSIIGIIAIIFIIIGGVQYMTSLGDPGKVKKAKDTILYAVIGLVIIILAAVIVNTIIGVVKK